jgi:hypothetical protein
MAAKSPTSFIFVVEAVSMLFLWGVDEMAHDFLPAQVSMVNPPVICFGAIVFALLCVLLAIDGRVVLVDGSFGGSFVAYAASGRVCLRMVVCCSKMRIL